MSTDRSAEYLESLVRELRKLLAEAEWVEFKLRMSANMPIDGCHRTFDELTRVVLPAYMACIRENMASPTPMSDFAVKGRGPVALKDQLGCTTILVGATSSWTVTNLSMWASPSM